MNFDLSNVEFSRKDIKLGIKVPKRLTEELAYFMGIHVGDGSLTLDKQNHQYLINYTGHLIDEYEFHENIIIPLIKKLFNKDVKLREDKRKNKSSVKIQFKSKTIFTFLSRVIDLTIGNKNNSGIPSIIKQSNDGAKINFLRGLADTDFTLTFKAKYQRLHYYPVIALSSASRLLVKEVNDLLIEQGLKPYFLKNRSYYYKKRGDYSNGANIDINGLRNLELWMHKIGFNSQKHLTKYRVWRKYGFCPPNTNILQRRDILNGKLDITSFYSKPL